MFVKNKYMMRPERKTLTKIKEGKQYFLRKKRIAKENMTSSKSKEAKNALSAEIEIHEACIKRLESRRVKIKETCKKSI